MSGSRFSSKLATVFFGSFILTVGCWAQDPQQPAEPDPNAKPKAAARGIPSINDPNATVENSEGANTAWRPDDSPATGLLVPSIGAPELAHNYWVPGLEYGSTIQSRPLGQQATSGWYVNNYIGADLSLVEASGRSQLALNYSGGGYFSTSSQLNSGPYQQLAVGGNVNLGRFQVQLVDYFAYLPDSQFGFANGTNLALPGISGTLGPSVPGLGTSVVPNQSIYAAVGPRYSNAFAAQTTYLLGRRSSLTFGGSYGLLHFTQSGNVDTDMAIGSAGYNYALNKTDSIGLFYRFSSYHYVGQPQAIGNHVVNVVYVKKINKRLAFSIFAGPQITTYRVPIGTQTSDVTASGGATLNYAVEHGGIGASYFHGLANGGGVLLGSNTDLASMSFTHQFGRVWSFNASFGYSHNTAIGNQTASQAYGDWFVGGGVSRPFGRNVNFAVSYTARIENSNVATCSGPNCSSDYTQNMISISLQWHTRPFVLP